MRYVRLFPGQDLGIHTELMMPPVASLIQSGAVTNRYKKLNRYKNVYTLAAGDESFYEFLNDNSSMEARPRRLCERPEHHRTK